MADAELIESLRLAVAAVPDDLGLRVHLGRVLLGAGRQPEAIAEAAEALRRAPDNADARALMGEALGAMSSAPADPVPSAPPPDQTPEAPAPKDAVPPMDWAALEQDLEGVIPPMFVESSEPSTALFQPQRPSITLADVGGMESVKKQLNLSFLAPLHNEELRTLFGKSLRGGLLLYGPPGVGKTYVARALAGEISAAFLSVSSADVIDVYQGSGERNMHEVFETARQNSPCVLFFDEVDAMGRRRSRTSSDGYRGVVNQLLTELDGVADQNEGIFVLAATNSPWDVDPALRRPGRFDRTILVLPPDDQAREAIWRSNLLDRPVANVNLKRLAALSDGLTGADIVHACETGAGHALMESVTRDEITMISQSHLEAALSEIRPSIGAWLDAARNMVLYGNDDGTYDELHRYLRKAKRL
jgi:SpoVK/Ycf46/Vps4 family AAA+-type ATPase